MRRYEKFPSAVVEGDFLWKKLICTGNRIWRKSFHTVGMKVFQKLKSVSVKGFFNGNTGDWKKYAIYTKN